MSTNARNKKLIRTMFISVFALLALIMSTACNLLGFGTGIDYIDITLDNEIVEGTQVLNVGDSIQARVFVFYTDGTGVEEQFGIIWQVSDESVARISDGFEPGIIEILSPGTVTLTADYAGFFDSIQITAVGADALAIEPGDISMVDGSTTQLTARATLDDSSQEDVTALASWNSSVETVATVSDSGLVSAVSTGTTVVSATYQGQTAQVTVTVAADLDLEMLDVSFTATQASIAEAFTVDVQSSHSGASLASQTNMAFYLSSDQVFDETTDFRLAYERNYNQLWNTVQNASVDIDISDAPLGDYYLVAWVDANASFAENDETNNVAVSANTVSIVGPDLVINSVDFGVSTSLVNGQSVSITSEVQNSGQANMPNRFKLSYYLSTDATLETGVDSFLGEVQSFQSLTVGQTQSETLTFLLRDIVPGDYFLITFVEPVFATAETDTANNVNSTAVSIDEPDLVIASVTSPAQLSITQPVSGFTSTVTVRNDGVGTYFGNQDLVDGGPVNEAVTVSLYFSDDAVITESDLLLDSRQLNQNISLVSSAVTTVDFTLSESDLPLATALGDYYIGAIVDSSDTLPESDESNNTLAAAATTEILGADFVITNLTSNILTSPVVGSTAQFDVTIANEGNASHNGESLAVRILASDGSVNYSLQAERVDQIFAAAQSRTVTVNVDLVGIPAGPLTFYAVVERFSGTPILREIDTSNNRFDFISPVTLLTSDLEIVSFTATPTVTAGGTISLNWEVRNNGPYDYPTARISWYWSDDTVYDPVVDEELAVATSTGALASGASDTDGLVQGTPSGFAGQTKYILMVVDSGDELAESDKSNNVASVLVTFNP